MWPAPRISSSRASRKGAGQQLGVLRRRHLIVGATEHQRRQLDLERRACHVESVAGGEVLVDDLWPGLLKRELALLTQLERCRWPVGQGCGLQDGRGEIGLESDQEFRRYPQPRA